MPTPTLPLPPDGRLTALRGLVALLQRDPDLKRIGTKWSVWDGSTGEVNPPTLSQCPWVRITATPERASLLHGLVCEQPVRVQVETAVAGTNVDNSLLLWAAIERAIFRGVPAVHQGLGISRIDVEIPGWGQVDADAQMVLGSGVVSYSTAVNLTGGV